ncbi:MAG: hypothetical protein RLZZ366_1055 [Pseudomonadota bacterium]
MTFAEQYRRNYPEGAAFSEYITRDGWPLRVFSWPASGHERGSILFQGGRGDTIEKYLETFADWHHQDWSVTSFDWRGQGGSGRFIANPHIGHCPDFAIWIEDLKEFYADWEAKSSGPHSVIGHSMGGHLVLRAMAEKAIRPHAAVLISPMLGFDTGKLPLEWANWLVQQLIKIGLGKRVAWRRNERPAPPWAKRQKFLTNDVARYSDEIWWKLKKPELELGPPSFQWLQQAYSSILALEKPGVIESIDIQISVFGTRGYKLVSPEAIVEFTERMPFADLKMYDVDVAHEILRERDDVREDALSLIDFFLGTL